MVLDVVLSTTTSGRPGLVSDAATLPTRVALRLAELSQQVAVPVQGARLNTVPTKLGSSLGVVGNRCTTSSSAPLLRTKCVAATQQRLAM